MSATGEHVNLPTVSRSIGYWRQGKAAAEGFRGIIKTLANEKVSIHLTTTQEAKATMILQTL